MTINIDALTEAELIDLSNRIVARLRLIQQMRAHSSMLDFRIGERVWFEAERRPAVHGVLTRYNRKTVTVISEDGAQWNVSPSFLRKAASGSAREANQTRKQLRKR